jgi:hypothetical protein
MRCYRPCWIGRSRVNYEDPKGFLCEPSSCQAGESCLPERESAKETLRVSDDDVAAGRSCVEDGRCCRSSGYNPK